VQVFTVTENGSLVEFTQKETVPLSLGSIFDYFDVNNAQSIAITRDLKYGFVTAPNYNDLKNHHLTTEYVLPYGSNIGIIQNPTGIYEGQPKLVAATRPIPLGITDDLV